MHQGVRNIFLMVSVEVEFYALTKLFHVKKMIKFIHDTALM